MNVVTDLSSQALEQIELSVQKPRIKRRLTIVRLAMEGLPGSVIAEQVGLSSRRVYSWVSRFNREGIEGLVAQDKLRSTQVERRGGGS